MNILGVIRASVGHGRVGGMELISHKLYSGLVARGHKVRVLTSCKDESSTELEMISIDGVEYHFMPTNKRFEYSDNFHRCVEYFFNKWNASLDLVHSASAAAAAIRKNRYQIPIVVTWHGTYLEQELDKVYKYQHIDGKKIEPRHIEALLINNLLPKLNNEIFKEYQKYDAHVVISKYMENIVKCYGIKGSNINTIHNGLAPEFFDQKADNCIAKKYFNIPENKICLGVVGRMGKEKGEEVLKSLAKKIDPNKFLFFFVGNFVEKSYFENLGFDVVSQKVEHCLMPLVYRAMDVFVNPTLRLSGLDMTVLEARSSGVSVLVSDLPQYKLFDEEYDLSLKFFRAGNSLDMSVALSDCLKSLDLKKSSFDFFCEKEMIKRYEHVFEGVLIRDEEN